MNGCHLQLIILLLLKELKNPLIQLLQLKLRNRGTKLIKVLFVDLLNVVKFQQKLIVQKIIIYLIMINYQI